MNPTAEAWFAVVGVLTIAAGIALGLMLLWALITGRLPGVAPARANAEPQPEYPERRPHQAGGCWCGELHEGTAVSDGQPVWKAS